MHYVYLLESLKTKNKYYTGITNDLKERLNRHNTGKCPHTTEHKPWKLNTYIAFSDKTKALSFENYLKTGSGRAFATKRL